MEMRVSKMKPSTRISVTFMIQRRTLNWRKLPDQANDNDRAKRRVSSPGDGESILSGLAGMALIVASAVAGYLFLFQMTEYLAYFGTGIPF
jgi:hypothetical protein